MSSTFSESIIDALRLAGHRFHLGLGDPFTWSSDHLGLSLDTSASATGLTATALAGVFLLFHFAYHRPGKRALSIQPGSANFATKDQTKMVQLVERPPDGSVKVSKILIHPIKHDRKWCIIDAAANKVVTARDTPRMVLIAPHIELDLNSPHGGALVITFPTDAPDGCTEFRVPLNPSPSTLAEWDIIERIGLHASSVDGYIVQRLPEASFQSSNPELTASEILSVYFGKPVHLMYKGPRARPVRTTHAFPDLKATSVFQDMFPLLVLSEESMEDVEREVRERVGQQGVDEHWKEGKVHIRRFRPNIVFEGGGPFAEDNWEVVAIGRPDAPPITLVSKCGRCLLPNVSPDTGIRDAAVPFKMIMKFRTGIDPDAMRTPCVGSNGVPAASGVVSVGDTVFVRKMV
ncbi:hypothetical protein DXG03_000739 [Asterophora parasitica]|uniref:MOSC domain-containing protein n=1 Tax=Asterophora parasitica TaxID=117018 RepID=A0A9P7KAL5_9AGAR|nr:hypothetical protein DXG03_000739 [Asterophora parasitica]